GLRAECAVAGGDRVHILRASAVESGMLRAKCTVAGGGRVYILRGNAAPGGGIGPRKRLRWGSAGGSSNRCGQGPVVRPGHPPIRVCICEQRGRLALATG